MAERDAQLEDQREGVEEVVTETETAEPPKPVGGSYQFPLVDADDYKGKIIFRLVKVKPLVASGLVNLGRSIEQATKAQIEKQKEANGDESEVTEADINETQDAEKDVNGANENYQTYSDPNKVKEYGGTVSLYLPQAIQIRDAVQYDNFDLGTLGALTQSGLQSGGSVLGSAVKGITEGISSFMDAFSQSSFDTPLASLALTRAASKFGDQVGGAVQLQTRVTVNPNTRALFKSVALREIPFTFRLVATNQKEAEEIKEIIKFFRSELYPGEIADAERNISIGYKLPNLFEIEMQYDNKQVATKFLDSYLRDVSVTYNQNGAAMHSDGNFTDVEITLSFIESRALSKKDVEQGY